MNSLTLFLLTLIVLDVVVTLMVLAQKHKRKSSAQKKLIVFTRYPEPGQTKTRLIPALGAAGAATLQRQMTEHTLRQARQLVTRRAVWLEVRYEGGDQTAMQYWLGAELTLRPQGGGDLGARLQWAMQAAFDEEFDRVVVIGTDCPELSVDILEEAFRALRNNEVVIGPAADGGYYLIGFSCPLEMLFQDIAWGTETVLATTLAKAAEMGIVPFLLPTLNDIDRPEDLRHVHFDHHSCVE